MKELKRFLPYLIKYKKKILWGFLFVTIANVCEAIIPRIVGKTIDLVTHSGGHQGSVNVNILLMLGLTLVGGVFMYYTRMTIIAASRLIEFDLRRDFLLAIESQPMSFFIENPTGTLMALVTNDISAAREFLGPALMFTANTVTMFFFALFFMLSLNPAITLLALIPLPIIAFTTYIIGQKVHVAFRDVQKQFADLTARAQESFSGIRVVRAYVRETYEIGRFKVLSQEYLDKNLRLARIQSIAMPIIMVFVGLSLIIVLAYGGMLVMQGKATLGGLTQFFIYLNLLIWPVAAIGWITNLIQRASASAGRLGKIFDLVPKIKPESIISSKIKNISGNIEFRNVSFKYKEELPLVLKNVNLSIPNGSNLGITGTVGSGKSSLINLITKLYEVTEGELLIDSAPINEIPDEILRKSIGIIPQEPFLFSMSIAENIRFGKPEASLEEIIEAAKFADLHNDIEEFPDKYETQLGERGISLSGGQKQRLAIARAIIRKPSILILDDALSSVDSETEKRIMNNLRDFLKDNGIHNNGLTEMVNSCTMLIISHRISTIQAADNIIVLENGEIIESGTNDELFNLKGKYYELSNLQMLEQEIEQL
jgi:ATP-binding cassette, subfamily B, multidrug efflux pump